MPLEATSKESIASTNTNQEEWAYMICESTEHRASEHAAAVEAQAAMSADLILRPASLLYDVAEPASFVEPCRLCESTEHATRGHAEAMQLLAEQKQAFILGNDSATALSGRSVSDFHAAADVFASAALMADAVPTLAAGGAAAHDAAEVFACTICESTEHRASEHAAAVEAQAAMSADLILRPASLLYDVAEPAGFVEPCRLCESTEHATHIHDVALSSRVFVRDNYDLFSSSVSSKNLQNVFLHVQSPSSSAGNVSVSNRLSFSKALAIQESHQLVQRKNPYLQLQSIDQSDGRLLDFTPVFEIVVAGERIICGGCLKELCGSVFTEGMLCFYCESFEHNSSQCDLARKRKAISTGVVSDTVIQDIDRASVPSRLSFSKALAKQQLERDKAEEEERMKLHSVDDDEVQPVSSLVVTSVWIPKVSNKGWRAYTLEKDKQFLQWAVYANDVEAVADFIEGRDGAPVFDVDHCDFTRQTAIHRAAQSRCISICKKLIDYGCDYNAQDVSGTSPVLIFARDGNAVQLEAFIDMCK